MGHSDGISWLLRQPAAIISEYTCGNFAQRVPAFVKNIYIFLVIWGVIWNPDRKQTVTG